MAEEKKANFIATIIEQDLATGKYAQIVTRFPPEPNGYLHLGHAKSICLNFGLAAAHGGKTNLRFDDTNPATEEEEFVENIKEDIRWLGFQWDEEKYVSDYFDQLYELARMLIRKGLAYVDDSTSEEIARLKGTPTQPGKESDFRNRSVEENITLLEAMKAGKYVEGSKTLRAKIDMTHPNMLMRDPVLYRIKRAAHHRTKDTWCIYPMYDFAHGQSDAIEGVTHSLCTLEFAPHREVYNRLIEQLELYPSRQYEFARLNVTYTVMSKRKLRQLVEEGHVNSWSDPRMPTLSGMRRRGYPAESIRRFCEKIGVAKRDNLIDIGLLEFCVRDCLDKTAQRRMVVLDPIKVVLTNYPVDQEEMLMAECNPNNQQAGTRAVPFGHHLYIERDDFTETPPKGYFRLFPGGVVRLKHAYIIRCDETVKDSSGNIIELRCTYFPDSKSGSDTSGIRTKSVLHWVSEQQAIAVEVRLYDRLFNQSNIMDMNDYIPHLNPTSLTVIPTAYAEPDLRQADSKVSYQFLRTGYFCLDPDTTPEKIVFNRSVTLRDLWAKKTNNTKN